VWVATLVSTSRSFIARDELGYSLVEIGVQPTQTALGTDERVGVESLFDSQRTEYLLFMLRTSFPSPAETVDRVHGRPRTRA